MTHRDLFIHCEYTTQDFAQYFGKGDGRGLHSGSFHSSSVDIVSDITAILEPDAFFDAIMCIAVFEHLPEPIKAIGEFARLLKPGGLVVLTAPFCSLSDMAPYHFYGGFNRYFCGMHLHVNAFELIELRENGKSFEYLAQEIWRVPEIAKRYARRGKCTYPESLSMLEGFSGEDTGSSELLNFGYHLIARKWTRNRIRQYGFPKELQTV